MIQLLLRSRHIFAFGAMVYLGPREQFGAHKMASQIEVAVNDPLSIRD